MNDASAAGQSSIGSDANPLSDLVGAPTIDSNTRAEAVVSELRRRIVSGELPPGTRLRQVDVAKLFNVSTTPVREAFTALAREGLLRQDAHRGVQVFRPTVDDVRENYEIRLALEPLAAEIAARQIGDEDLATLTRLDREMAQAHELKLGTELNREFHFIIYTAANRPQMLALIERLRHSADAYVQLLASRVVVDDGYRAAIIEEHREILSALRDHRPAAARKAMQKHLRHNLELVTALIDS